MDFLFDGPFLYIILIAILSSLFRIKKGKSDQREKRPPRPTVDKPTQELGPIPDILKELEELFEPMKQQSESKRSNVPKEHKKREEKQVSSPIVKEKPVQIAEQKKIERREKRDTLQTQMNIGQTVKEKEEEQKSSALFESDKVLEGIIWSQILEPPKGRKRTKH